MQNGVVGGQVLQSLLNQSSPSVNIVNNGAPSEMNLADTSNFTSNQHQSLVKQLLSRKSQANNAIKSNDVNHNVLSKFGIHLHQLGVNSGNASNSGVLGALGSDQR